MYMSTWPTWTETGVKKRVTIKDINLKSYMSFKLYKGRTKIEWLPVTTSTALVRDTLVEFTSGLIAAADADDTVLAGVLVKTIASSDTDYASARSVGIRTPIEKNVIWEADTGGSFVASDIGTEYGISDSGTVDRTETTAKVFLVTEVLSATKVRGYLKINQAY